MTIFVARGVELFELIESRFESCHKEGCLSFNGRFAYAASQLVQRYFIRGGSLKNRAQVGKCFGGSDRLQAVGSPLGRLLAAVRFLNWFLNRLLRRLCCG